MSKHPKVRLWSPYAFIVAYMIIFVNRYCLRCLDVVQCAWGMVGLAQLVRASDCGPEGRRFKPDIPPQI